MGQGQTVQTQIWISGSPNINSQPLKQKWTGPIDNGGINGLIAALLYQDTFSWYTVQAIKNINLCQRFYFAYFTAEYKMLPNPKKGLYFPNFGDFFPTSGFYWDLFQAQAVFPSIPKKAIKSLYAQIKHEQSNYCKKLQHKFLLDKISIAVICI